VRRRAGRLPLAGLAIASMVIAACGGGASTSAPAATQGAGAASTVAAVAPTVASTAPTAAAAVAPTVAAAATAAAPAVATIAAAAETAVSAAPTSATGAATGKALRVGLVTDVGKIDDKSFNQSAWEGVQRAATELGAEVKFIESTDPKDYAKNIEQFGEDGYDVIVIRRNRHRRLRSGQGHAGRSRTLS
jgi:basic membrane lipoprotein Med (substrate-binding protein (PBP1-ABC) superfamily)